VKQAARLRIKPALASSLAQNLGLSLLQSVASNLIKCFGNILCWLDNMAMTQRTIKLTLKKAGKSAVTLKVDLKRLRH